jgi:hypothetical protein
MLPLEWKGKTLLVSCFCLALESGNGCLNCTWIMKVSVRKVYAILKDVSTCSVLWSLRQLYPYNDIYFLEFLKMFVSETRIDKSFPLSSQSEGFCNRIILLHRVPLTGPWRQYTPLKRRSSSMRLHGAVSQKAIIFLFIPWSDYEPHCILYWLSHILRYWNVLQYYYN